MENVNGFLKETKEIKKSLPSVIVMKRLLKSVIIKDVEISQLPLAANERNQYIILVKRKRVFVGYCHI